MADDIAIDIRLQPPSKADIERTVSGINKSLDDARRKTSDPGISGWVDLAGMSSEQRQSVFSQRRMEAAGRTIRNAAPTLDERAKTEALNRLDIERKANSELAVFGKGLSGINKALTFVGLAGIGAGTAASFLQYQMATIRDANSFSNPALEQKIRQAERDEKGGIGRQGKELSEGDLRRARNRADALTDESSMSSRWTKYWANAANNIKDFWSNTVWSEGRDAERARAKGLSSTGAGGFIDAGKWADSGEAVWQNMASGLLQAPNVTIKDNTLAIQKLTERLNQLDQWVNPGDKNWMTEERADTIAKLNSLGVRR